MNNRFKFYEYNILKFLDKDSKILIVGAGKDDFDLFDKNNFSNFVCSNYLGIGFNGKTFKKIDINNINEPDQSYDYVVAHACIHHCSKPHSGILEMYRVSKKGILVIESKDSFLMDLMIKFKFAEKYELSAINTEDEFGDFGGVDNTKIPNYVYRWTEKEIRKLINSYDPKYNHIIKFNYKFEFENILRKVNNMHLKKILNLFLILFIKIFSFIFKKQSNLFSFFIDKEESQKFKHKWI